MPYLEDHSTMVLAGDIGGTKTNLGLFHMGKRRPVPQVIESYSSRTALNVFVSIFGAVAGNLALTGLATGGIYLGGGISPKVLGKSNKNIFMRAFTNKGRFKDLLEKIPVRVILNEKAALIGAAFCALSSGLHSEPPKMA